MRSRIGRRKGRDLELDRNHGDRDTEDEDAGHGNGSVALPVLGPAVRPTRHAPDFGPKVTSSTVAMGSINVVVISSPAHFRSLSSLAANQTKSKIEWHDFSE